VRLRIFYLVLSKVFACNALVPTLLANPLNAHFYAAFGRFAYVAFSAKFELVIGKPCANVYLRHHACPLARIAAAQSIMVARSVCANVG